MPLEQPRLKISRHIVAARLGSEHQYKDTMNNGPLGFAIGLPCLTVLASLIVSLFQIAWFRDEIRGIRADIKLLTGKVYETIEHER